MSSRKTRSTGKYTRRGGLRVFKIVSFYLFRYGSGRLGEIPPEHMHEVAETRWLPLDEAPRLLSYGGERKTLARSGV